MFPPPVISFAFNFFCFSYIYIPSSPFLLIQLLHFSPLPAISHLFCPLSFPTKLQTIKETEKSHLGCNFTSFFPFFFPLIVVCLPKQYYKSNSTPVNSLQDWLSSTVSHRSCRIINTDLYHSLVANIHKCQYTGFLLPVKIHGAIWANFMNSTKRSTVERKQPERQ